MQFLQKEKKPWSNKQKFIILALVSSLLLILYITFSLLNVVFRYWELTLIVMVFGFFKLAHMVGTALMFPGAFSYYRGSIQMNYSTEMSQAAFTNLLIIEKACDYVMSGKEEDSRTFFPQAEKNVDWIIGVLAKDEKDGVISPRKLALLKMYQYLNDCLSEAEQNQLSIRRYVDWREDNSKRKDLKKPSVQKVKKTLHAINHIRDMIREFFPKLNAAKMVMHQCKDEKFYSIRYGLYGYDRHYNYKRHLLNTGDNEKIELILIDNLIGKQAPQSKKTVLFCNPNGAFMQMIASECRYVDFYIDQGYCVCLWNYRGYGASTGSPCLSKNEKDVLEIYEFLDRQGYTTAISHGYSIGGPVAIYLAYCRPVQMLIADRTFGSLDLMGKEYGKIFFSIMKLIFRSDRKDYTDLYLKATCKKLMICDPYDEVIKNSSSLKNGVAQEIASKLGPEQNNSVTYLSANEESVMFKKVVQSKEDGFLSTDFVKAYIYNTLPFMTKASRRNRNDTNEQVTISSVALSDAVEYLSSEASKSISISATAESASSALAQQVTEILGTLDSTGMANLCNDYKYVSRLNEYTLYLECESYLNGLIVFGSYSPYMRKYKDPQEARQDTILKIYQATQALQKLEQQTRNEKVLNYLYQNAKAISGIRHQLCRIGVYMHDNLNNEAYDEVGILLPTKSGHNGELTAEQYFTLSEFVNQFKQ